MLVCDKCKNLAAKPVTAFRFGFSNATTGQSVASAMVEIDLCTPCFQSVAKSGIISQQASQIVAMVPVVPPAEKEG